MPDSIGATTVNKVCASGMKATMLGHDLTMASSADIVITGGMGSMTNAPYLLDKARAGYRAGHDHIFDRMMLDGMLDGLEDDYEHSRPMGDFGEAAAAEYHFSREDQNNYAIASLTRARAAIEAGTFATERL